MTVADLFWSSSSVVGDRGEQPERERGGGERAAVEGMFRDRATDAVADAELHGRVAMAVDRFVHKRAEGLAGLEDADGLRRAARG